jgi:hypothetical protein
MERDPALGIVMRATYMSEYRVDLRRGDLDGGGVPGICHPGLVVEVRLPHIFSTGLHLGHLSWSPRSISSLSYTRNLSWNVCACGKSKVEKGWGGTTSRDRRSFVSVLNFCPAPVAMVPPRSGREWGWEGLRASKSGQDKVVPVGLGIPGIIKAGVREGLSPIDRGKPCHNRGDKP